RLLLERAAAVDACPADSRRHRGDHEEHPGRAGARPAQGTRRRLRDPVSRTAPFGPGTLWRYGMSGSTPATELEELRTTVRDFLSAKSGEEQVRKAMDSDLGYDPALWAQMAEQLGLQGLALPAEHGGDGFGFIELAVVLEELGRALSPSPFLATVVLAVSA